MQRGRACRRLVLDKTSSEYFPTLSAGPGVFRASRLIIYSVGKGRKMRSPLCERTSSGLSTLGAIDMQFSSSAQVKTLRITPPVIGSEYVALVVWDTNLVLRKVHFEAKFIGAIGIQESFQTVTVA